MLFWLEGSDNQQNDLKQIYYTVSSSPAQTLFSFYLIFPGTFKDLYLDLIDIQQLSVNRTQFHKFSIMITMNKKLFYQRSDSKGNQATKARGGNKLSMDDMTSLASRAPSDFKKRNSNHSIERSKNQRSVDKKFKTNVYVTSGSSILASTSTSPLKSSVFPKRNNEAFSENKNELKDYKFYYQIGFGGFGRVWKVNHKQTMKSWAMKEISKHRVILKNNIQSVLNERRILKQISHPFLINMKCAFQDDKYLYLVMDYLRGGDLRYHICYKNSFTQKQIKFIIANILIGLEYIHRNKIIHKDLKPQNIVFEETGYVRITDFGIAKSQMNPSSFNARNESSGTPVYMAPEILFKKGYSYQSDFYALGVILHELITGKRPYEGKNKPELKEQMMKRDMKISPEDYPSSWSRSLADLVNRLLEKDPSERIGFKGIQQIKQHNFFVDINWKKLQKKQIKPPFIPNVVCQMKQYLDQIMYFNQLNQQGFQNQENIPQISQQINQKFQQYEFGRNSSTKPVKNDKKGLKKCKRASQGKIIC